MALIGSTYAPCRTTFLRNKAIIPAAFIVIFNDFPILQLSGTSLQKKTSDFFVCIHRLTV